MEKWNGGVNMRTWVTTRRVVIAMKVGVMRDRVIDPD
jgi:hypothetical protein